MRKDFTSEINTCEISDSELDSISGGTGSWSGSGSGSGSVGGEVTGHCGTVGGGVSVGGGGVAGSAHCLTHGLQVNGMVSVHASC